MDSRGVAQELVVDCVIFIWEVLGLIQLSHTNLALVWFRAYKTINDFFWIHGRPTLYQGLFHGLSKCRGVYFRITQLIACLMYFLIRSIMILSKYLNAFSFFVVLHCSWRLLTPAKLSNELKLQVRVNSQMLIFNTIVSKHCVFWATKNFSSYGI